MLTQYRNPADLVELRISSEKKLQRLHSCLLIRSGTVSKFGIRGKVDLFELCNDSRYFCRYFKCLSLIPPIMDPSSLFRGFCCHAAIVARERASCAPVKFDRSAGGQVTRRSKRVDQPRAPPQFPGPISAKLAQDTFRFVVISTFDHLF